MVTPPLKDGHIGIPHEILEQLAHINLAPYESRCLFLLLRKTYGHDKEQVQISKLQWEEGTGLRATHVYRTLRRLRDRKIVTKNGHQYGVQKHYTLWKDPKRWVPDDTTGQGHGVASGTSDTDTETPRCLFCREEIQTRRAFQVLCDSCLGRDS